MKLARTLPSTQTGRAAAPKSGRIEGRRPTAWPGREAWTGRAGTGGGSHGKGARSLAWVAERGGRAQKETAVRYWIDRTAARTRRCRVQHTTEETALVGIVLPIGLDFPVYDEARGGLRRFADRGLAGGDLARPTDAVSLGFA